jgi:hypothetical protein
VVHRNDNCAAIATLSFTLVFDGATRGHFLLFRCPCERNSIYPNSFHVTASPASPSVADTMDHRNKPKAFAEDDSKNPPARTVLDKLTRRFSRPAYVVIVLLLYVLASTALGFALAPVLWLLYQLFIWSEFLPPLLRWLLMGFGLAIGFFLFGFGLMVVVPIYNLVLPTRVRPFKGGYYSLQAVPWLLHNGLFYLVRFTFSSFRNLDAFWHLVPQSHGDETRPARICEYGIYF